MASFSNIQSSWANQYGSIDTWNIKIRPLVIILWHNILVHQQGALNSLLTTIPNRNYRANRSGLILQKKIRKFAENKQTDRQTNKQTDREFNYRGHFYPLWIVGVSGPTSWQGSNFMRTENRQTDRDFNYRGHSYPLWIFGVSGPIILKQ